MITLMAQLCALCAVCALMEMVLGDADRSGGVRMIGGLLMLHLVLSGGKELCEQLLAAESLMSIYETIIG